LSKEVIEIKEKKKRQAFSSPEQDEEGPARLRGGFISAHR